MTKLVIPQIFKETVKKYRDKKSLGEKDQNSGEFKYITYDDLNNMVDNFASAMLELGIKPEDKVALMSENCPEWVVTDLGLMSIAALNVPIYPTLTYQQLEYILNNCGAKGIVVSNNTHYQKVTKLFDQVNSLEFVIHFDDVSKVEHSRVKTYNYQEILALGKEKLEKNKSEIEKRTAGIDEENICSIIYTSGTTGDPKGVMLTHKNFMSNAREAAKIMLDENKDDLELSFLPLSHVLERVVYYTLVVTSGKTVAYAESIEAITKNLLEVRPTLMASVPRIYEKIYSKVMEGIHSAPPLRQKIFNWAIKVGKEYHEATSNGRGLSFVLEMEHKLADKLVYSKIKARTGGNISTFVSGGAPLMREIAEFFTYIGLPILEGYGLTESSPVICFNRPNNFKFGTVGQPIPDVEVKIAEDGEILAKGPNIMKGYYGNPVATAEAIDQDGWLHTGDIGELDSENFLKITDRKKELIIMSNGKNVAPQPIENIVKTSKYVEQIALIGDNRKYISALIVPNFENLLLKANELGVNTQDKKELCKDNRINDFMKSEIEKVTADKIARFEQIKKFVLLCDEFSLEKNEITPTLKLKRKIINQNHKDSIESMYEPEMSHSG
jgi:long-chain acyl-CoA synthetase